MHESVMQPASGSGWRDYLELTKPKVVVLMMITAVVGMILASPTGVPPLTPFVMGIIGIAFMAASSATMNHIADSHIDRLMKRTHHRPVATGRVSTQQAIVFALLLMFVSSATLYFFVNTRTTLLALITLVGYSGIYTLYLKRATSQNIVIGGLAGAIPPVLGWVSITNSFDAHAWLLALIIFIWTPPHFWALAIYRIEEYRAAKIPMLPVTHGISMTKDFILLYTILLGAVSLLPFALSKQSYLYLIGASILGMWFFSYAVRLQKTDEPAFAMKTFRFSSNYLMLLFVLMIVDRMLFKSFIIV